QHVGHAPTLFFGAFSAAARDVIAFATRVNANRQLAWIDRQGHITETVTEPANWGTATLALLHDRAVVPRDSDSGNIDLWLVDLTRHISSPLTSDPADENHPVWSPDGTELAYTSNRNGLPELYVKNLTKTQADRLLVTGNSVLPWSWTPDGRYIIYWDRYPETSNDLWLVSPHDGTPTRPLIRTPLNETAG